VRSHVAIFTASPQHLLPIVHIHVDNGNTTRSNKPLPWPMMATCLALNFLECFVVSLINLKRKLSRAQFVLYLKERMLLMILRSHQYGTKIDIEALNFKNLCNKIMIMIFINMLRIVIHIEVRRTVRRN
jgi:hypothetical protein